MLGGAIQNVNGYEAADGRIGVEAFTERAQELAAEVWRRTSSRRPSCSTRRRTARSSPEQLAHFAAYRCDLFRHVPELGVEVARGRSISLP